MPFLNEIILLKFYQQLVKLDIQVGTKLIKKQTKTKLC